MKKIIYMIAFTTTLGFAATAQATTLTTVNTELVKACEVCPYADASLCSNWVANCPEDQITTIDRDLIVNEEIDTGTIVSGDTTTTTATVSSCPSGTTKSSDGCCCVNN